MSGLTALKEVFMEFQNQYLERLIRSYRSFSVEGFNIFALGSDNLPHLICACPNKDFARAIQSLVTVAEKAKGLQPLEAYLTGNCYLSPKVLADGTLGLVATVINDATYLDGNELEHRELNLLLGSQAYEAFARKFLVRQNEERD
jgi:hypothetical protein